MVDATVPPDDYDDEDSEEAAEDFWRAAMQAFAEDWDSEADAIYDQIEYDSPALEEAQ